MIKKTSTFYLTEEQWVALRRLQEEGVIKSLQDAVTQSIDLFLKENQKAKK